jgi:hypothetical protein
MDPSRLLDYSESREDFYYFLEKIDFEIDNFDPNADSLKDFSKILYLKVLINDIYLYLEKSIKLMVQLFKEREKSFEPVYDIIILTRKNLSLVIESIESGQNSKYDIEESVVNTLKVIDKQFYFLYEKNTQFYMHPILGNFRSMNLCILNYSRR